MGIERFFSSIQRNDITNLQTSFTRILEKRIPAEYLYVDFNSIVYITRNKIIMDLNYLLNKIIIGEHKKDKRSQWIIKEYWLEVDDKTTPEKFNKSMTDDVLDKLIISKILEYVVNIVTNYVEPDQLKIFYIAVDGVPNKSKMMEQKKRRYIGAFAKEMSKKILQKHERELKKRPKR